MKKIEAFVNIYQTSSGAYITGVSLWETRESARQNRNEDLIDPDNDIRYVKTKKISFID